MSKILVFKSEELTLEGETIEYHVFNNDNTLVCQTKYDGKPHVNSFQIKDLAKLLDISKEGIWQDLNRLNKEYNGNYLNTYKFQLSDWRKIRKTFPELHLANSPQIMIDKNTYELCSHVSTELFYADIGMGEFGEIANLSRKLIDF